MSQLIFLSPYLAISYKSTLSGAKYTHAMLVNSEIFLTSDYATRKLMLQRPIFCTYCFNLHALKYDIYCNTLFLIKKKTYTEGPGSTLQGLKIEVIVDIIFYFS